MRRLLEEIISNIVYDTLLEEGKDPVELLHYKYGEEVPSEIIDKIISIDPTKKKSYSRWALDKWENESDVIKHALSNGRLEKLFDHFKQHQDVIQLKDFNSVSDVLRDYVPDDDTVLSKSDKPTTYVKNLGEEVDSELANDFDIVFDQDDWLIAVPNTYEAECKLGENMKWCTANAYGNGRSYYDNYLSKGGKYYVNFDLSEGEERNGKSYPYTRYQFHFETKQFMDKNDNPVQIDSIGIPESAIEFYESEGYDESNFQNEEERMEAYEEERGRVGFTLSDRDWLTLYPEYNDDYNFVEPDEQTTFYLYDENDSHDPIDWLVGFKNPHIYDDFIVEHDDIENSSYLILKDEDDDFVFVCYAINSNRWRNWMVFGNFKSEDFFEKVGENVIAFVDNDSIFNCYNIDKKELYAYKNIKVDKIINTFTYNQDIFFECTGENGKRHTLFSVNDTDGPDVVIYSDMPKNGEHFVINENGVIEGVYKRYDIYGNDTQEENADEYHIKYGLYSVLEDGNYLVYNKIRTSQYDFWNGIKYGNNTDGEFNILDKDTREPIIPYWFNKFYAIAGNLYLIQTENLEQKKFSLFTKQGKKIGDFDKYSLDYIDANALVTTWRGKYYFIDTESGKVFDNFEFGTYIYYSIFGVTTKEYRRKLYDIRKRSIIHNECDVKEVFNYGVCLCELENNGNKFLYSAKEDKILMDNIAEVGKDNVGFKRLITKLDGKVNLLDSLSDKIVLPMDVDEIVYLDNPNLVYKLNGLYFPFNVKTQTNYDFTNGSKIPFRVSENGKFFVVEIHDGNYELYFMPKGSDCECEYYSHKENKNYQISSNAPQEVITAYRLVTGKDVPSPESQQNQQNGQVEDVRENFFRTLKRIEEAFKW